MISCTLHASAKPEKYRLDPWQRQASLVHHERKHKQVKKSSCVFVLATVAACI